MSKVVAPAPEPLQPAEPSAGGAKRAPKRGKYIDFAPRRKQPAKKPVAEKIDATTPIHVVRHSVERRTTVVKTTTLPPEETLLDDFDDAPEDVEASTGADVLEDTLGSIDTLDDIEDDTAGDADDGPLAEFNDLDDGAETEEDLEAEYTDAKNYAEPVPPRSSSDDDGAASPAPAEDFLADDDTDDYVESVLAQADEAREQKKPPRRSPFLKNYHIEKRPLSNLTPEKEQLPSQDYLEPTPRPVFKEEEFAEDLDDLPADAAAPVVPDEEEAGSKFGMIITVVITVLLGAGVGVFVYLAFFQ